MHSQNPRELRRKLARDWAAIFFMVYVLHLVVAGSNRITDMQIRASENTARGQR